MAKKMVHLSQAVNKLLGNVMLDAALARQVFGPGRSAALADYNLTARERAAILTADARSLPELAAHLCRAIGQEKVDVVRPAEEVLREHGIQPARTEVIQAALQRILGQAQVETEAGQRRAA